MGHHRGECGHQWRYPQGVWVNAGALGIDAEHDAADLQAGFFLAYGEPKTPQRPDGEGGGHIWWGARSSPPGSGLQISGTASCSGAAQTASTCAYVLVSVIAFHGVVHHQQTRFAQ